MSFLSTSFCWNFVLHINISCSNGNCNSIPVHSFWSPYPYFPIIFFHPFRSFLIFALSIKHYIIFDSSSKVFFQITVEIVNLFLRANWCQFCISLPCTAVLLNLPLLSSMAYVQPLPLFLVHHIFNCCNFPASIKNVLTFYVPIASLSFFRSSWLIDSAGITDLVFPGDVSIHFLLYFLASDSTYVLVFTSNVGIDTHLTKHNLLFLSGLWTAWRYATY